MQKPRVFSAFPILKDLHIRASHTRSIDYSTTADTTTGLTSVPDKPLYNLSFGHYLKICYCKIGSSDCLFALIRAVQLHYSHTKSTTSFAADISQKYGSDRRADRHRMNHSAMSSSMAVWDISCTITPSSVTS